MSSQSQASGREVTRPTILFVDDDDLTHTIVAEHLKGWPLISAHSGEEALEIINEEDVQIIITDISMPGMDGLALLRQIKRQRPVIQVIVATSSDDVQHVLTAFAEGANDFLLKPLKRGDIEEALENCIARLGRWKATLRKLFTKKTGEDDGGAENTCGG